MTVGDVMTRSLVLVHLDQTLREVQELFQKYHFHHLLVVDHTTLVGVVSDRDLLKNLSPFLGHVFAERPQDLALLNRRVHQIMTRRPITAPEDLSLTEAAERMIKHDISCLPVVDDQGRPMGVVAKRDLLRGFCQLVGQA